MNIDIRLKVGFFDHPKTIKLQRRIGADGVLCLQRLWLWAAQYRTDGTFNGMTAEDIEIAANWSFGDNLLVTALVDVGFLDEKDGHFSIHDWQTHNAFAFHSDARRKVAKDNAAKRWDKRHCADGNADGNATCNANGIPDGNAPSPYPIPYPSRKV